MADQVDPKRVRELKIKCGVVKRLTKEKASYVIETEKVQEKLNKMKAENPDDYAIKKQIELLEEASGMVPDCRRRLVVAFEDLQKLLDEGQDLKDTPEYKAAQEILDESRPALASN